MLSFTSPDALATVSASTFRKVIKIICKFYCFSKLFGFFFYIKLYTIPIMRAREASDNVTDDERQLGIERGRKVRRKKRINVLLIYFENNIF